MQLGIGQTLATRFGYQSADAEAAYQRANELAAGLEAVEAVPALLGLWQYYEVRSDPTRRRALATRSHELAGLTDDPAIRLEGISALSTTLAFEGEFAEACTLIDRGLLIFDAHGDQPMEFHMPQHPVAGFCGVSGPLLWMSGDFVAARQRYERLQEFALHPTGRLGPFTAGYARVFSAWFSSLLGDFSAMAAHATSAMDIGAEHGFLVWLGAGYIQLGIATALLGDTATGIAMTSDGIDAWGAAGSGLMGSYYRFWLGLAHEVAGDPEAALRVVHEGIAHSESHRERVQSALLHRSRGRLLERMGRPAEASVARRLAVRIAAEQGARFCELLALHDLERVGDAVDQERHRLEKLIGDLSADDLGRGRWPRPSMMSGSRPAGPASRARSRPMPYYVERGGEVSLCPPGVAMGTRAYCFVLEADRTKLAEMFDRYLNEPSMGAVHYEPVGSLVILMFANIPHLSATLPPDVRMGYMVEREVAVWTLGYDTVRDQFSMFNPYMIVNHPWAMAMGREVYGFPKQLGVVTLPDDGKPDKYALDLPGVEQWGPDHEFACRRFLAVIESGAANGGPGTVLLVTGRARGRHGRDRAGPPLRDKH